MLDCEEKEGDQGENIKELSERCERGIGEADLLLRELVSNPPLEKSFQNHT